MAARALLVALCLAAAGLASCGGSGGGDDTSTGGRDRVGADSPRRPTSSAPPQAPQSGGVGYAPAAPNPVVTRANRLCRRSVRPLKRTTPGSLAERATQARREHARLQRISRALAAIARRGRIPQPLRRYRSAVKDQMFLDARIERAAKEGDMLAVRVGLRQNRFNQRRRQQLADEHGLHGCL